MADDTKVAPGPPGDDGNVTWNPDERSDIGRADIPQAHAEPRGGAKSSAAGRKSKEAQRDDQDSLLAADPNSDAGSLE